MTRGAAGWALAAAVLLAALAVLPGSLGFLKLTHEFAAHPWGAFLFYEITVPAYVLSCGVLLAGLWLHLRRRRSRRTGVVVYVCLFLGVSLYGFLMHTTLMFRPVRAPSYLTMDEGINRFGPGETVIGVLDRSGKPYAYVARLQRRPHAVFQANSPVPFVATHCVLANSSMAYELTGDFSNPSLYISSVLANNLVFYDRTTGWSVQQIHNATIDGRHRLQPLPTVTTTMTAWNALYPDSKLWVRPKEWRDEFYLRVLARASVIDPGSPDLVYPLRRPPDPRRPLKDYVMGVKLGDKAKAYPADLFRDATLIEDTLNDEPIAFLSAWSGEFVQLYSRRLEDARVLSFRPAEGSTFRDIETGSLWGADGVCVQGELTGRRLAPVPHYSKMFWFCWADFYPDTMLYPRRTGET